MKVRIALSAEEPPICLYEDYSVHFDGVGPLSVIVIGDMIHVQMKRTVPFFVIDSGDLHFITNYEWETGVTVAHYDPSKVLAI